MTNSWAQPAVAWLGCLGAIVWIGSGFTGRVELQAGGGPVCPSPDTDGDLLPDDVELVLFTDPYEADSDDDGIDDFSAAVHFRHASPYLQEESSVAREAEHESIPLPHDHAARVVLSTRDDPGGQAAIWVHYLFRFVGPAPPLPNQLSLWVDNGGTTIPLTGSSLGETETAASLTPEAGLLRFSMRVGTEDEFCDNGVRKPLTFGTTIVIQGRTIHTGAILFEVDGSAATVTPVSPDSVVIVGLNRYTTTQNPFWAANRVCTMTVAVLSTSRFGHLCEFHRANCDPAPNLRCPPTCVTTAGQLFFVPNGLAVVMGGR